MGCLPFQDLLFIWFEMCGPTDWGQIIYSQFCVTDTIRWIWKKARVSYLVQLVCAYKLNSC